MPDWKTGLKQAELGSWVKEVSFTKDSMCSDSGQDFYIDVFPSKLNFDASVLMCYNLGGTLYYPKANELLLPRGKSCPYLGVQLPEWLIMGT